MTESSGSVTEKERVSRLAYEYFIDEIKREDGIVMARLTAALALQGILFASLAFIVSNGVPNDVLERDVLVAIRRMFQLIIVLAGLSSSLLATGALQASKHALNDVRFRRRERIENSDDLVDHMDFFPGEKTEKHVRFTLASWFPHGSMLFFTGIWSLVLLMYVVFVVGHVHVWPFWPETEEVKTEPVDKTTFTANDGSVFIYTAKSGKVVSVILQPKVAPRLANRGVSKAPKRRSDR